MAKRKATLAAKKAAAQQAQQQQAVAAHAVVAVDSPLVHGAGPRHNQGHPSHPGHQGHMAAAPEYGYGDIGSGSGVPQAGSSSNNAPLYAANRQEA